MTAPPHVPTLPPPQSPLEARIRSFLPRAEPRRYLWDPVADYPTRPHEHLPGHLCLAMVESLGGSLDKAAAIAVALDLRHDALLIQRDLCDHRNRRRGRPTLHHLHGVPLAINAGATLGLVSLQPLIVSSQYLEPAMAAQILELSLQSSQLVLEATATEQRWRRQGIFAIPEKEFLRVASQESGLPQVLVPLRVGTVLAGGVPPAMASCLEGFGQALAAALVIVEDLEDLLREDSACLNQGRRTLPLLHTFRLAPPSLQRRIRALFLTQEGVPEPAVRQHLLRILVRSGGVARSRDLARHLLRRAVLEQRRLASGLWPSSGINFLANLPGAFRNRLERAVQGLRLPEESP